MAGSEEKPNKDYLYLVGEHRFGGVDSMGQLEIMRAVIWYALTRMVIRRICH